MLTSSLQVLGTGDLPAALALLERDPVQNVFIASRLQAFGLESWRLGAQVWGYVAGGHLEGICYAGANLVPASAGPDAVHAFAERARRLGRRCSSIVGPEPAAELLWKLLEPDWGPARDVRPHQQVMTTATAPLVPPDPGVRRVRPEEIDVLLPASVAMFTEEVGVSPAQDGGLHLYRNRVQELIAAGRAFARIEDGRVAFKAEIGALSDQVAQVQGVWVDPRRRGEGLATAGMAAVVAHTLRDLAPVVALYVNHYNTPARAAYRRVGFAEIGTCMTVLF